MEFKRFVNAFIRVPCQIVRTGRRIVQAPAGLEPVAGRVCPRPGGPGPAAAPLTSDSGAEVWTSRLARPLKQVKARNAA